MKNKVCCIVVTYNIGYSFYKCFNSIINQVDKVVIVDNGSGDETQKVLKDLQKNNKTHIIYNNENHSEEETDTMAYKEENENKGSES